MAGGDVAPAGSGCSSKVGWDDDGGDCCSGRLNGCGGHRGGDIVSATGRRTRTVGGVSGEVTDSGDDVHGTGDGPAVPQMAAGEVGVKEAAPVEVVVAAEEMAACEVVVAAEEVAGEGDGDEDAIARPFFLLDPRGCLSRSSTEEEKESSWQGLAGLDGPGCWETRD